MPTLRIVAVKQIPVYEDDKRQQMVNELKALYTNLVPIEGDGATTHRGGFRAGPCPHIVAFHDTFSNMEDGNISIVVEFMDGGSLEDIVETGGCQLESVLANISYRVLLGAYLLCDGCAQPGATLTSLQVLSSFIKRSNCIATSSRATF